ncbi:type II toxin-antitoxin system RelE/ParE family toxin [Glaesserella parasuis]|uniref:type II toxin-antitoxin system RelE/ParE family toxin n=1 Tax=Glaesserella parasuis TaxID=738 RepID=UPI0021BEC691|nr:type II toxin-antitoxin system RelE/ParE family toxin [Glaesserella parasuis]MCT8556026.1 type II toxin-antitoxin system RelE/ParE family toxin [Glaesserella parasuis]MCT8705224.1 type II toxin-antitoxin system RelE/ParE family toxin [Glaesserella parasuis]MCT8707368.1 type II toxin-antitoxin system RelE/ParE family toxin [Glaesserella parasuis]MCT8709457.1 type II toxin-antitoxin system RelE/ParE family toxin [Glaesserella parasuis]MCT8711401.1 type II toxin-antitoxin system RelE/ParE fami
METEEYLTFIETKVFEEDRKALMSDDEYQKFQAYLLESHELGDFIQNTGGCQKIRWKLESNNKGKSGGVRVIYYVWSTKGRIYLITMYSKSEKDNLNEKEKAIMRTVVAKLTGENNGKEII